MSDLEALSIPEPRRVTVAGRDFALTPIRMGQIAAFSRRIMPVSGLILSGQYVQAVTDHYEPCREAIAIATGAEAEWLDSLLPTDFLRLVQAVVEVNGDFFVQRLTPLIFAMQAQASSVIAQIGQPSLPSSENTDTQSRLS